MESILKIIFAVVLGGLIGYEREHLGRPAGFRTHILVCVGATLVMMLSEYIFTQYKGLTNLDPARLGAQVISGIGFLGAGTILKVGETVKGLTTAASLWAVSCIGLAIGAGFYSGAIIAAFAVYIVLITFKRIYFENFESPSKKKGQKVSSLKIELDKSKGSFQQIEDLLKEFGISIRSIKYLYESDSVIVMRIFVAFDGADQYGNMISGINKVESIRLIAES